MRSCPKKRRETAARLAKSRVWIVDPLDGTREFGERRTDWAVHIALAIDGIATVGAVAVAGVSDAARNRSAAVGAGRVRAR